MGREQRDTGVREEALGRRHVVEGGGGVGAERQDERRPGRVAGVVAVLHDAARVRVRAVDEADAAARAAVDRRDPAARVPERHRPLAQERQREAELDRAREMEALGLAAAVLVVVPVLEVGLLLVAVRVALVPRGV